MNKRKCGALLLALPVVCGSLLAGQVGSATPVFLRGDANDDGSVTLGDVIYVTQYLFGGGPVPLPSVDSGDANCDGRVSPLDAVYLVNYKLRGGPQPKCPQ